MIVSKNENKNNLEVDTLIQVNKQLTKENRNLLKKVEEKHADNQDLKIKINFIKKKFINISINFSTKSKKRINTRKKND